MTRPERRDVSYYGVHINSLDKEDLILLVEYLVMASARPSYDIQDFERRQNEVRDYVLGLAPCGRHGWDSGA